MIYNYLVAFARSLSRDRVFFFINILGLSLSLAVGMLSISFISDLTSYDHFQENKDRLFRIISTYRFKEDYTREIATTSNVVANSIQEDIPGIGVKTLLRSNFTGEYIANGEAVPIDGIWADENFFKVFTYPLIAGDPENALKEPNSIVLTRKLALRLFNSTEVIGQTIKVDSILYVVYLLIDQLVLTTFAFHKAILLSDVLFGGTILWGLTLLIVLTQTIQAGAINPTQVLRTN